MFVNTIMLQFMKKLVLILVLLIMGTGVFVYIDQQNSDLPLIKPLGTPDFFKYFQKKPGDDSFLAEKGIINILLLGIDRRSKTQLGFNTDTMILVSLNPTTNKVLFTSVPRDLWINGNKINALYTIYGWETLKNAFEQITGQEIHGYIMTDFEDFRWLVDAFGGIPVTIQRTFTDYTFPNNTDTGVLAVTFTEGYEKMGGERSLTFARSRKGTNGEGSDLMRAKRQHLILQGMLEAIKQPESIFWPMDIPAFYEAVTNFRMETTLTLEDTYYLWDFYKDKDLYSYESFVVDDKYVYHPGMYPQSPYHAWVFIAREPGFADLHADIKAKLEGTYVEEPTENQEHSGTF